MRGKLFFLPVLIFLFITAKSQHLSAIDTGKYRINLPGYWKPGNKIWQILTDKLPVVCTELKDKDVCGDDCNPAYTIELEISDPVIFEYFPSHISSDFRNAVNYRQTENWEIRTSYSFESSLLLRDEKGKLITRFILVDTNEVWSFTTKVTLASYAPPMPQVQTTRRNINSGRSGSGIPENASNMQLIPLMGQEGETPFEYINKNKERLVPSYRDLFAIIDNKIKSW